MSQLGLPQLGIALGERFAGMSEAGWSPGARPSSQGKAGAGAGLPGAVLAMGTWRSGMPEHLKVLQGTRSSRSLSEGPDGQVSLLKCSLRGVGFSSPWVPGVCAHAADYLPVSSPA